MKTKKENILIILLTKSGENSNYSTYYRDIFHQPVIILFYLDVLPGHVDVTIVYMPSQNLTTIISKDIFKWNPKVLKFVAFSTFFQVLFL